MTSRNSRVRISSILVASLAALVALLAGSAPVQADDDDDDHKLIKVSSWCGYYVYFTNRTSHEVDVDYEIVVPLSPFSSKDGHFSLDPHETYRLKAYGGQKGGPVHRLYYNAERGNHDQSGHVDQWKHCGKKPLVKYYVKCGYAYFTNVFNHKVKVKYQEGGDYGDWEDDFFFYPGQYKRVYFESKVLWWSAESKWDDHYRRQVGTIYQPKHCDEYKDYKKKHDDDDDDDEWELHDAGDFILKIIPFSDGPLIDKPFKSLFGR